jgi:ubiquitin C-terminal hydrolase
LQSLLHTPMFEKFFIGESVQSYLNPTRIQDKTVLSLELNALAKEMVSSKTSKVVPSKFHKHFIKRFPMFNGTEQHDCHECLSLILDSLHEELSRQGDEVFSNTLVIENPADKQEELEKADEQWKGIQGSRGSLVSDVCGGQTRTTLSCPVCNSRKVLFEIFNNLSLPIPARLTLPISVTVLYLNGKAVQIGIVISRFSRIAQLVEQVAQLALLASDKLLLGDYYPGSSLIPLSKYENEPILRFVRENSNLFAFEIVSSIPEAESYGRKLIKYASQGPTFCQNEFVDVKTESNDWRSGKVLKRFDDKYIVSLDYEDLTETFDSKNVSAFRSHTVFDSPQVLNIAVYHQMLRNKKVESIGFPQLVSIGNWYTFADLHRLTSSMVLKSCCNGQHSDDTPCFALKFLDIFTLKCGLCKACEGCPLPRSARELRNLDNLCIGVEWQEPHYHEEVAVHDSATTLKKADFKKPVDISQCFDAFMSKEKVDSKCEKCGNNELFVQVDIWRVPDILILSLKRFAFQQGVFDKIDQAVTIPFYAFDISQWVKGVEVVGGMTLSTTVLQNAYDLYAIILHSGSIGGGHYTTMLKVTTEDDSMWVMVDDINLYVMKEDPDNLAVAQNAYMLFYRRRKFSSSNLINLTSNFA